MVIKGRSRGNGAQLAAYLLKSKENDHARIIDIRGTAQPDDLKRSLVEMSLSSELTKRGKNGLYHSQVNPAIGEDRPMTHEDWLRAADILEESLGYGGQKRAIVLHEKNGRVHGHVVWERFDHDTGRLRSDSHNFKKHDQARAQIEQEFGHTRTPQKAEREPTHKEQLTDLWEQHPEGASFVQAAEDAGYIVAQGNARRPFRVITPDGQSLDLIRQLEDKKAARNSLKPIRDGLPTEAEALQQSKAERMPVHPVPEVSDNLRKMSDNQDLAASMTDDIKQGVNQKEGGEQKQAATEKELPKSYSYSFKVEMPPALPHQPVEKSQSDNSREMSDSQDLYIAMLEHRKQKEADRQTTLQQAQEQGRQQTQLEPTRHFDPITGAEISEERHRKMQEFQERQKQREQERKGRSRDTDLSIG